MKRAHGLNTNKIKLTNYHKKEMGVSKSLELDEEVVIEREKLLLRDKGRRERLLTEVFGIDAGRITTFSEDDRGENSS